MQLKYWWNDIDRGKTEVLGQKPVPLCPLHIVRGLACDQILAYTLRG